MFQEEMPPDLYNLYVQIRGNLLDRAIAASQLGISHRGF